MSFSKFDNVRIAALTCAVPSYVQEINTDPDREDANYIRSFIRNTGIKRRHISVTGQSSLDLCVPAGKAALKKAGWDAGSADALIFLTQTPDYSCPGNGVIMQNLLSMRVNTIAFDINLGCSAFPYGLYVACSLLQNPEINRIVVAYSDTQWPAYESKEATDADNSFIFGEGGAVLLLEKQSKSPPIILGLWTDGSGFKYLHSLNGVRAMRMRNKEVTVPNGELITMPGSDVGGNYMDGPAIMSFTTDTVVDSIKEFFEYAKADINSYDGIIFHQANLQIIKTMAKRMKVDMGKIPISLDRYANTSAASVALTIADAYADRDGNNEVLHLLASGFGIGLSWGVTDFYISPSVIEPIFEYDGIFEEGLFKRGNP